MTLFKALERCQIGATTKVKTPGTARVRHPSASGGGGAVYGAAVRRLQLVCSAKSWPANPGAEREKNRLR